MRPSTFSNRCKSKVNEHLFRHPAGAGVPVVLSKLRDHAGVLGTAAIAWEKVRWRPTVKERPLRTTVIGSYPFPSWLE